MKNEWHERDLSHFRRTTGTDVFDVHDHFDRWMQPALKGGYNLYEQAATSSPATQLQVDGYDQPLINLASYNYLGLSVRPEVTAAATKALQHYGLGAGGSPLLSGLLSVHQELAEALAAFKNVDRVLLFPTGYSANVGAISALVGPEDTLITDMLAHASILDGAVLSRAKLSLFRHSDMRSLEQKLKQAKRRKLVVVEGVYSMDGDVAPLPEIVALCRAHGARLMVDEAHSAFVYGKNGCGLGEHFGVEDQIDIHMGTLSKSLGGMGGYVGGSEKTISYMRPYSRSQVFSCAISPVVAGGMVAALRIAHEEPELRTKLWENVTLMHEVLGGLGIDTGNSTSQVIPIMIRDDIGIFQITRDLMDAGVYLNPVRYPAVKRGQARFRVSISAAHEREELRKAARIIGEVLRAHGVIQ